MVDKTEEGGSGPGTRSLGLGVEAWLRTCLRSVIDAFREG